MTKMAKEKLLGWFCRKILDKNINLDSFNEKLIIQKAVYLGKQMGMNFNYDYGWWVRGVYSSKLTVDLYNMKDEQDYNFNCGDEKITEKLSEIAGAFENPVRAFELVSTVVYAQVHKGIRENDRLYDFITSVKPWFSDEEIRTGIELVGELNKEFIGS